MRIKGKKVKKRHAASIMAGFIGASLIANALRKSRREKEDRRRYFSAIQETLFFGAAVNYPHDPGKDNRSKAAKENDLHFPLKGGNKETRGYRNRHTARRKRQAEIVRDLEKIDQRPYGPDSPRYEKQQEEKRRLLNEYKNLDAQSDAEIEEYKNKYSYIPPGESPSNSTLCHTDTYYVSTQSRSGYACA